MGLRRQGSAATPGGAALGRGGRRDHHGHPQRRDRQDAVGAQLPARPPPSHGRAADARGRQGRQRRAHAQDARRARHRDRASPGGPTGTRIVEQLTEESILNDFVRIREESRTNTAVLDPTTGEQTEINERGPAVTEREIELFRDKLLYLSRRRGASSSSPARCRAASSPTCYADLIRDGARRRASRPSSTPTASRCATPCARSRDVISPNILEAEELVGHEFNDDEDMVIAVARDAPRSAPREAIMTTARRLLRDGPARTASRRSTASGSSRARRSRRSARATRSSPASSPRATPARRPPSACGYGVACGAESTQRLGGRARRSPTIGRLVSETQVERVTVPAEVS